MLLKIYVKELKDALRDRRTLLLSVFLPILLLSGLTLYYESLLSDNTDQTFTLAVDKEFDSEAKQALSDIPNLKVKSFANPKEAVNNGDAYAYLQLENQFMKKVTNGDEAQVNIYGDSYSRNSSTVISQVESAMINFKQTIVQTRLESKNVDPSIVNPFTIEIKEISQEDGEQGASINLLSTLLPMIIVIAIASGAYPVSSDLFAGEKDKKTMEALLMTPVSRTTLLLAKWLTISTIGVLAGIVSVIGVMLETIFLTEKLKEALQFGDKTLLIIIISLFAAILFALLMSALQMLASILAKTVKESQNYISPIMMLAILPIMLLGGVGLNELTAKHFIIPIMNFHALFKELLSGIISYENLSITFASTLLTTFIIFVIARTLFLKDKWVLG